MGSIIADPKIWAAAIGLITLLVGLYRSFLSKKARLKREQKDRNERSVDAQEGLLSEATTEIVDMNKQIEQANKIAQEYFEGKNKMIDSSIWNLIEIQAKVSSLDPILLGALVLQESAGNPWAMRYEPLWSHGLVDPEKHARDSLSSAHTEEVLQKSSLGLCQVMGVVAREIGHKGWLTQLFKPEMGLHYGALVLSKNLKRFGSVEEALAAYNAGSPRRDKSGQFINQDYIDSVKRHMEQLKSV